MKRRSFLQYVIGGITALFLPKAKAKVDDIVSETLAKDPNWRDTKKRAKPIWRRWAVLDKEPEAYTQEDIDTAARESRTRLAKILHQRDVQIKGQKPISEVPNTRPITEGEIGPIESMFTRVWTKDGCTTIVRERKTFEGKIITDRAKLPEPAKMLHINFGRVIAICESNMYGEKIQFRKLKDETA